MKTDKNILRVFILNICFSIFELIGGVFTNSVSIISDAIHDFGDAVSIGISYFLERISKKNPDNKYTYGYVRYSVLGATLTNIILIVGSILVIISSIKRFINPVFVNYDGMILFAVVGVIVNFIAVYFTSGGKSLNQKAVNLHMLEDVFGWIIVLVGSIVIKFTGINRIDSVLSMVVALFIFLSAFKELKRIVDLFLEKTPDNINIDDLKKQLLGIKDIIDIHHIHIWSIDGINNFATMHVVTKIKDIDKMKKIIKDKLMEYGISHSTIEVENMDYKCDDIECHIDSDVDECHHHH